MPRIFGVDIPGKKPIAYSLRYLYGIGPLFSSQILEEAGVDPTKRADDLSPEEIGKIAAIIQAKYKVEGDLRREVQGNIRRLVATGSYRGSRHRKGLPVRGQRTKTNARTRKGPRKTVGAVRGKEARAAAKT